MSVDSTALERSALERKDRDELLTIAQALGGKPPSRAKKADIVGMILALTGVSPGEGSDADVAPDATPAKRATRAKKASPVTEDPDAPPAADEPPAEWELDAAAESAGSAQAGTDAEPGDGAGATGGGRGQERRQGAPTGGRAAPNARDDGGPNRAQEGGQAGGQGRQQRGDQQRGDQQRGDQQRGDQQRGDQQQGGQQRNDQQSGDQQPGDQPHQGQEDDGEGGNRRRRRRGRNRDRAGEGQGQGQGGASGPEDFTGEPVDVEGYLDLRDEGYGFLRVQGYLPSRDDVYISVKQARQFGLRKGDHLKGASRPALRNEKNPALLRIDAVNGADPDKARSRRHFEDLTPLFPDEKLTMEVEGDPTNVTARIVDLISPIGKGQRGLIVSPPKAGKTSIMKQIARSIEVNNPEVHLFVLLVDERPEEVTDMKRWLKNEASTVVASTFDRPSEEHTHVAELTIERAKRLVEDGHDVVVILDGITRLSRAYNLAAPTTGRIMSGGIDTGALYPPKKFFGAARNVEEGGSLTILATALVETGSRMDEVIFEEFKGTGNMELRLDRRLAERRIYPAIDVDASSTRHEELLFQGLQLQNVWKLRRVLSAMASEGGGASGLELLIDRMKSFKSNKEFLAEIGKAPGG
jgi:transcription termination factor Rho